MIDTHIHIIPGVDDGAVDMEVAIEMVKLSIEQGVEEIIATPHHNVPAFVSGTIDEQFTKLVQEVKRAGLQMKLHLANEIHLNEASIAGLESGMARSMGESEYLLIELPYHHYYPFHEQMIFDLQLRGYKVLLAHVERYRTFRQKPEKLESLIRGGFYGQMSCRYIVEKKTRKKAFDWIEKGLIHIVASDAHNTRSRVSMMDQAYKIIEKRYGLATAEGLFEQNPRRILSNEPLFAIEVYPVKRFKLW